MASFRKKRPRDANQLAKIIVDVAAGEIDDSESDLTVKRRSAGKRGAQARTEALTPEQRSEIARQAASARWKKGN